MGNCILRETGIEDSKEDKIDEVKIFKNIVNNLKIVNQKGKMEKSRNYKRTK